MSDELTAKIVTIRVWARPGADVVAAPFNAAVLGSKFSGIGTAIDLESRSTPGVVLEKTDLWADGAVSVGTGSASVSFDYIIVKN